MFRKFLYELLDMNKEFVGEMHYEIECLEVNRT